MHLFHCTKWTSWKWFHHNIRKLIKDDEFVNSMNDLELRAWPSFVDMLKNFFGNRWTENYKELVENLLKILLDIGANMSIKVYIYIAIYKKFQIIAAKWVKNKENNSIKIAKQWKSSTKDGRTNKWWLTTAWVSKGT